MMKRVLLFVGTNIAIIVMFSIVAHLFGIETRYLEPNGLNLTALFYVAAFFGFAGSFISLLLSKPMAKWTMKIEMIESPHNKKERVVYDTVARIAQQENIKMPEVGVYPSNEVNAFATGWRKNSSLVAVSAGLLHSMDEDEIEGVVGHEMAHIINGDMVTMGLIQGVVNTFVIFFARIAAYAVQSAMRGREGGQEVGGFAYFGLSILFEIVFGILASIIVMSFSRWREFHADSGSARYTSHEKMIAALKKLQKMHDHIDTSQKSLQTMKISDKSAMFQLFASHPPLEKRIEALQSAKYN